MRTVGISLWRAGTEKRRVILALQEAPPARGLAFSKAVASGLVPCAGRGDPKGWVLQAPDRDTRDFDLPLSATSWSHLPSGRPQATGT